MVVRAYYVLDGAPGVEGLVPTLRVVPKTAGVARAAMNALLDSDQILDEYEPALDSDPGRHRAAAGSSIKNGVATVDLSSEFESGGGSASAAYRLGQVVYTLTQFSTVRAVLFQVEGRTVTTFGSEGIVLDGPQTRTDFEDLLPSIFVDRPAFGAAASNPARISGNANVFEATFRIAILDAPARSSSTRWRWPPAAPAAGARSTSRCGTTSRRRSGGRCGCTSDRPRTAARRTSATTRSG